MADKEKRLKENVSGPWFVDNTCIGCGLCTTEAPDHFEMGNSIAYVKKQPSTPAEENACNSASEGCPVQAIGKE
jgi:ferredoxin